MIEVFLKRNVEYFKARSKLYDQVSDFYENRAKVPC
jgi:hypothetical protein